MPVACVRKVSESKVRVDESKVRVETRTHLGDDTSNIITRNPRSLLALDLSSIFGDLRLQLGDDSIPQPTRLVVLSLPLGLLQPPPSGLQLLPRPRNLLSPLPFLPPLALHLLGLTLQVRQLSLDGRATRDGHLVGVAAE